jgi:hypothetical protein
LGVLIWGRPERERQRFVRRLLSRHPALAELPINELEEIAPRVTARVRTFHVVILSLAAGTAAAFLTTPVLIAIRDAGIRIPMPVKVLIVALAFWFAWRGLRQLLIERQLTRAVSDAYPQLFCTGCGYCLLGLAPSIPCPECGKARHPTSAGNVEGIGRD